MKQVRVVTDSGADLPPDVVNELGIAVVPLVVRFGREMFQDGDLSPDAFWEKARQGPDYPGTSQPSLGAFEETYARLVRDGHPVLCITLTSKHSGTYSTAWVAAQRFGDRVVVMDSLFLSLGQGFQVLAAAHAAAEGMSLERVAGLAEQVRDRAHLFILLDTIEHLRRGGRANLLIPVLSRVVHVLNIKPILTVADGQLSLHSLTRSYERGLQKILDEVEQLCPIESLAVIHVRCVEIARDLARALAEKLDFPAREILVRETGPALSTHGGPKVIGVAAVQRES